MILKLSYIGLSLLMILVQLLIAKYAISKTFDIKKGKKKLIIVAMFILLWHGYIKLLSYLGVLHNMDFPPRFAIFLIIPAFILSGIFIYKNRKADWILNIKPHWLIFYQSFRVLIETIFVYSVAANVLHKNVTVEGYNYDMVFAFTAILVGFLLLKNFRKFRKLALAWNYLGLVVIAVIIFLFQASIYMPEMFGKDSLPFPSEFTFYPYILVAGFLMPSAVFVHLLSIVQLKRMDD